MPIERKRYEWPRWSNKRDWPAWGVRHDFPALAPIPEPELEEEVRWNQVIIPGPTVEVDADPPREPEIITTFGTRSLGHVQKLSVGGTTSGAWPAANRAIYVPFHVLNNYTVVKLGIRNGTTVTGNVDVGIYDANGTRLISSGSTAQAGTSTVQEFDVTDTTLTPGWYYLAAAMDGAGHTFRVAPSVGVGWMRCLGMYQQATAFPLPATATFAAIGTSYLPHLAASSRVILA